MITLLVFASLLINPLEFQNYLAARGVQTNVRAVQLGVRVLGQERKFFDDLKNVANGRYRNSIALVDPFMQSGKEWLLGFTSGSFAMVVYNEKNERGEDRKIHSFAAAAHEAAHICGLKHTTGCISLTDEAVMSCPNVATLGFLPDELKRMNKCF